MCHSLINKTFVIIGVLLWLLGRKQNISAPLKPISVSITRLIHNFLMNIEIRVPFHSALRPSRYTQLHTFPFTATMTGSILPFRVLKHKLTVSPNSSEGLRTDSLHCSLWGFTAPVEDGGACHRFVWENNNTLSFIMYEYWSVIEASLDLEFAQTWHCVQTFKSSLVV